MKANSLLLSLIGKLSRLRSDESGPGGCIYCGCVLGVTVADYQF